MLHSVLVSSPQLTKTVGGPLILKFKPLSRMCKRLNVSKKYVFSQMFDYKLQSQKMYKKYIFFVDFCLGNMKKSRDNTANKGIKTVSNLHYLFIYHINSVVLLDCGN